MALSDMNVRKPFPDIFPKQWTQAVGSCSFFQFRNLDHFRHEVAVLSQDDDNQCGMSYKDAVDKLMKGESDFPEAEQASIRNLVRSNLFKRGLITEEVYEEYQYTVDGTNVGVDVGRYVEGNPDCIISPARQYVDFFYELYVDAAYPWMISNSMIRENTAKLLATIEELERQHIFLKITLVCPISRPGRTEDDEWENFMSTIPLFSHKEPKSVASMSAIVNDRLLRKFYFAILEKHYGERICGHKGYADIELNKVMNLGKTFNEVDFFTRIFEEVGAY